MNKFIIGSFLVLGWGFYEMSGGADFTPETRPAEQVAAFANTPEPVPFDAPQVTRAVAIALPSFTNAAQVTEASFEATTPTQSPQIDYRKVSGNRVNMRTGPSTDYAVLDTLTRGTQAQVIEVNTSGWARVRVESTGQVGWMAARLLSDS